MTSFDKIIKEKLKTKYYIRFMDDFVLIVDSKEKARKGLVEIENFLGYRVWKTHLLIRN